MRLHGVAFVGKGTRLQTVCVDSTENADVRLVSRRSALELRLFCTVNGCLA